MIDYKKLYTETKNLSVLLVEDFEPLRREMSEVLEDLFEKVIVASDGSEALALYQTMIEEDDRVDLVISDIQMPIMDGVILTEKIRELNPDQVVIILSAYTDSKYLIKFINMGISKFLTKPIQQEELFETLYTESKTVQKLKRKSTKIVTISFGDDYVWNSATRVLKYNDKLIELTKHELLLLEFFLARQEHMCNGHDIIDYFYHKNIEINEKNIRNLVFKLRKKIPEKCIVSIYGLGYKFTL